VIAGSVSFHIVKRIDFIDCVHLSGEKTDTKKNTATRPRPDDLVHAADAGPGSPAAAGSSDQQASSASQHDIAAIATAPEMSPDMQKFIAFAGNLPDCFL